ncbi:MAG: CAP domain-containing protein [Bacteroidota bacterium]
MKVYRLIPLFLLCLVACQPDEQPNPNDVGPISGIGEGEHPELNSFQSGMLEEVNKLRSEGCQCGDDFFSPAPALSWNSQLEDAAARHTQDMAANNHFDHKGTDGSRLGDRVTDAGYRYASAGENIALGYNSIANVVKAWQESEGHCRNLMNPNFRELGAAEKESYWTQVFAKPF